LFLTKLALVPENNLVFCWNEVMTITEIVLALSLGKKVPQSPALRDPAFHSFESGKTSPEIERTMDLPPHEP
jgi:hypothetical protein